MTADIKASYNQERICLGEALPLNTPLSIILDVSERCNFLCNYCFRSGQKDGSWDFAQKNNLMTMDIFQKAVDDLNLFPQKIKAISLSGHGEPLCNPQIADMVRYLKNRTLIDRIEMHTNASMLTTENVEDIANCGFTRIVVSLQGLDAETYKKVCGVNINWNSFYMQLKTLYKSKPDSLKLHIKISEAALNKENNLEEQKEFYSMFGPIADTVSIEKVTPLWRNIQVDSEMGENKYGQEVGKIMYCPILFYKLWVAPDGEIYPCTGLPTPISLGNVNNITLSEAWNGEKRIEFLKNHLKMEGKNNSACAECYVPINTVTDKRDKIDIYKNDILKRLEEK